MKAIRPRQVFLQWTSRLALAAILALVALPTFGRLHAGAFGAAVAAVDVAATGNPAHADHAAHLGPAPRTADDRPAPAPADHHSGHGDCPYCPLLGQLADAAHPLPLLATTPAGPAPSLTVAAGHAGLRAHGLHARGPPATA